MRASWIRTRRSLLRGFAAALALTVAKRGWAGEAAAPKSTTPEIELNSPGTHTRRYRVRAVVTLFSIPIYSQDGVGAGCAMAEELPSTGGKIHGLQFSGGSWPEHLKGFNRFGMTQEAVHEKEGVVNQAHYISFMTSSPEKTSDEAWRSFNTRSGLLNLTVARGRATMAGYRSVVQHVTAPATTTWQDAPELLEDFRHQTTWADPPIPAERAYPTFLYSVRQAMAAENPVSHRIFMHNGKLYELRTNRSANGTLVCAHSRIIELETKSETEFRIWFDPASPAALPKRIEFRPKSFLRLIFEHDPAAAGPVLRPLSDRAFQETA